MVGYLGEFIALSVAISWTFTALFSEVASKKVGALQLNVIRMLLSLTFLSCTMYIFTGSPYPLYAGGEAWLWLILSGLVGYVFGDFCLINCYVLIGSRFGQLFMTLAPIAAAISAWVLLGERLTLNASLGMVVTLSGIALSILGKGSKRRVGLNIPLKGVLLGIGAGVGQGLGLVLSKVGMQHYVNDVPAEAAEQFSNILPFASTFMRAVMGLIGFSIMLCVKREFGKLNLAFRDKKGMGATIGATITGPFIGVSLSLMAVQYTEAGIASTLMALTPILIIWPAHLIFKQKITFKEVLGAIISVIGVTLFFI